MNCNVYIFGELSSGYTQYPEDGSSHVLRKLYPSCKAQTQIAISRDASMMYYCYVRKLNDNKYIGLCVAVNGYFITQVDELFALFESAIEKIAQHGTFIHFAKDGTLTTSTKILNQEEEEIDTLSENLRLRFEEFGSSTNNLPPVDYTVAKDSIKEFTDLDDKRDIVRASYTYGYTFIYKDKDFDTVRMNSYRSILKQLNDENNNLKKRNGELTHQITRVKAQKRNLKWISFLGAIVFFFSIVLWNKVLFPKEVTSYETGEFVYYGPIENNKPHGTGVAIYPPDDEYGRKYYIGNFVHGERQDTAAILFYQDGDYFYGVMSGDNWDKGILYMNSDDSHFSGEFKDNNPYNGVWYDHKKLYKLIDGERTN